MSRSRLLLVVLAATLAATVWTAMLDEPDGQVLLAERRPHTSANAAAIPAASPRRRDAEPMPDWPAPPASRDGAAWPTEPSRLAAWVPPPPPVPLRPAAAGARSAAASQAELSPPPFPYSFIGRVEDGDSAHALFLTPQRTLGAKPRQVIDGQWRVDEVGADGVTLTWLPGGVRQTLTLKPS